MEEPVHARPGHPSETRIPLIRTFAAVLPTIAFIFIGLRFHVRQCMVGRTGVDDWLALVAWCIMTSEAALAAWGTTLGFGLHKADINPYLQYKLRAVVALVPLLGQLASMTVILSVLTYYRRLSPARSFHILCYTVMAITVFNGTFRCTLGLIWCFHIDTGPGFCPNQNLVGLINVSIVIGLSFFIWCMPIPLLWKLKRASVLKRLALIATFCVGLIATIACASRFLVMNEAKKAKDPPWVSPWLFIIAQVEVCAGLIAASLPTLRPLWSRKPWSTSSGGGSLPGAKLKHMEERVDSGAGTKVLARAQAGWEVVSLTATWQGVQRYYHTRWGGRKRSIIEVMEIPGLGVLDQHLDNPFLHSTFAEERGIVAGNGVDTLTVASTAEGTLPYSSSGNSTRSLVPPPAEINHRRTSSGDSSRGGSTPIPPPPQQDATIREQEASEPGDVQPPESVETTPIAQSAAS